MRKSKSQQQYDEIKESLEKIDLNSDTITLSSGCGISGYEFANTSLTSSITASISSVAGPYTISSGTGTGISNPWATSTSTGKLKLEGENADIEINGVSILKMLQERLNVLIPNPELEKEWDELRELGELYRQKEIEFKEKSAMWRKLKSSPPVDTSEW